MLSVTSISSWRLVAKNNSAFKVIAVYGLKHKKIREETSRKVQCTGWPTVSQWWLSKYFFARILFEWRKRTIKAQKLQFPAIKFACFLLILKFGTNWNKSHEKRKQLWRRPWDKTVPPMKTDQHFPVEKGIGNWSDSSQLGKLIGLQDTIYNSSLFGVLNRVFWTGSR